jgi:hypothetical protein
MGGHQAVRRFEVLIFLAASLLGCQAATKTLAHIECKAGDANACFRLGCLSLGDGGLGADTSRNAAQSAALFGQACDGGVTEACVSLGNLYTVGEGVAKDRGKAAALYRKACDARILDECDYHVAIDTYLLEPGVDPAQAVALNRKACELNDAKACVTLGDLYARGVGVAKDLEKAWALYQKACDRGNSEGCFKLGTYCETGGWGIAAPDFVRAMRLYRQACDGGVDLACKQFCCRPVDDLDAGTFPLNLKDTGTPPYKCDAGLSPHGGREELDGGSLSDRREALLHRLNPAPVGDFPLARDKTKIMKGWVSPAELEPQFRP